MKLIWSPERALKAYLDTVKSCEVSQEPSVAEVVSAMAAGWNAGLVVETWSRGGEIATSVGLAVAAHHTGGKHICIVPDEESREEYAEGMRRFGRSACETIVGDAEEAMDGLEGIDFLVVDCKGNNEFGRVIRAAKLGERGAVLVCTNASSRAGSDFRWSSVLDGRSRVVRSVLLPVGKGLDVAHVGATGGSSGREKGRSRWIKRIDQDSGEEFVIRK
ncbi:uncharacterized protein LOC105155573 [Sesamum indicum]|uniref:Uncharacterized protein LOC105155573 n=1 Tax=Sesamum indicum TaxID=4182 RepID=A0A6I9SJM5_SESIN|nr:uncharacterized protein LOC105155573 [Sesamum indicum]